MNPFDEDYRTVSTAEISRRLAELENWGWRGEALEAVRAALDDLPQEIPLEEIEDRLELLPELCPSITVGRWGVAFEILCPELYADPKESKKTSDAIPGSRSRLWRLSERARCGLALHHRQDSHGVAEPVQAELFA